MIAHRTQHTKKPSPERRISGKKHQWRKKEIQTRFNAAPPPLPFSHSLFCRELTKSHTSAPPCQKHTTYSTKTHCEEKYKKKKEAEKKAGRFTEYICLRKKRCGADFPSFMFLPDLELSASSCRRGLRLDPGVTRATEQQQRLQ